MKKTKLIPLVSLSAVIAGSVPLASLVTSCSQQKQDIQGLFKIDNGVLTGFNPNLTPIDIAREIHNTDTITIPEEVTSIADNAFFKDGKSTIPSFVVYLDFTKSQKLETIGINAFNSANFMYLRLPMTVKTIKENAFSNLKKLALVDLCNFTNIPNDWSPQAWTNISSTGTIRVIDIKSVDNMLTYAKSSGLSNWTFDPIVKFNILNIDSEGILHGFNPEFLALKVLTQQEAIGETLIVPSEVKKIADDAFYDPQATTKVPNFVKTLYFAHGSQCTTIGKRAFCEAAFTAIHIPGTVTSLGSKAFGVEKTASHEKGKGTIEYIDLSELKDVPLGWVNPESESDWIEWGMIRDELGMKNGILMARTRFQNNLWRKYFQFNMSITQLRWTVVETYTHPFYIYNNVLYGMNPDLDSFDIEQIVDQNKKKLIIPAGVNRIVERAFYDTVNNKSTIPSNAMFLEFTDDSVAFIGDEAFRYAPFSNITLPKNVTSLGFGTFGNMSNLSCVDLSRIESVDTIGSWRVQAFNRVHKEQGIFKIRDFSFIDSFTTFFTVLGTFEIDENGWQFDKSIPKESIFNVDTDGILHGFTDEFMSYSEQGKRALIDDTDGVLNIPEGVKKIDKFAFCDRETLVSTIPSNATQLKFLGRMHYDCEEIGAYAFYNSPLEVIQIPYTAETVGDYAFGSKNDKQLVEIDLGTWSSIPTNWSSTAFNAAKEVGDFVVQKTLKESFTNYMKKFSFQKWNAVITGDIFNIEHIQTLNGERVVLKGFTDHFLSLITGDQIAAAGTFRLTIPCEVTEIADNAFYANGSSTIPISVFDELVFAEGSKCVSIGKSAFSGVSFGKIKIPGQIQTIGSRAFSRIDNGLSSSNIREIDLTEFDAIPEGWHKCTGEPGKQADSAIFAGLFNDADGCVKLTRDTISTSTLDLYMSRFNSNDTSYTQGVTWGGAHWNKIVLAPNVFNIKTVDGNIVLDGFSDDFLNAPLENQKMAIGGDTLIIPKNIQIISPHAFSINDKCLIPSFVKNVKFDDSSVCKEIGESAFSGCYFVQSIQIPKSVQKIGKKAFSAFDRDLGFGNYSMLKTIDLRGFSAIPNGWFAADSPADSIFAYTYGFTSTAFGHVLVDDKNTINHSVLEKYSSRYKKEASSTSYAVKGLNPSIFKLTNVFKVNLSGDTPRNIILKEVKDVYDGEEYYNALISSDAQETRKIVIKSITINGIKLTENEDFFTSSGLFYIVNASKIIGDILINADYAD